MDRERLCGSAISTLVMLAVSAILMGASVLRDPVILVGTAPLYFAAAYYLWPRTITWALAQYRERGHTFAPTPLRVIQAALVALAGVLIGILISRLTGTPVNWGTAARVGLMIFAYLYLIWTPERAGLTRRRPTSR